jgi:hypothetical protein
VSDEWDPLARPSNLGTREFDAWFWDDVAAFQRTRPDLPRGSPARLPYLERRELMDAYLLICTAAKRAVRQAYRPENYSRLPRRPRRSGPRGSSAAAEREAD